jgi:hypothetical protein
VTAGGYRDYADRVIAPTAMSIDVEQRAPQADS